MRDLSVLIPAHNEQFLQCTINDILQHREGDTEILVALDNWSNPPHITDHPRVRVITTHQGQRGATNTLARYSNAKYLMKLDAHCSLSQGFDVTMMEDMSDDITLVPALANLHVYDWVCPQGHRCFQSDVYTGCAQCGSTELQKEMVWNIIPKPIRSNFYFDTALHFQYSEEDSPELVAETMSIQGSCFMVTRERYHELNLCDEAFGSWGQQGTEISNKTILSGGRVLSTKKAYYGHFFQEKMPNPVENTLKTQAYSRDLFLNNKWDKQIYPFSYILEKFWPVTTWTNEHLLVQKTNEMKCERSGIYSIENKTTGRIYVGSAKNIAQRFSEHIRRLRRNDHENKYLQSTWNKYGEQDFSFNIKRFCIPEDLLRIEQEFIDKIKNEKTWREMFNLNPNASSGFGRKHGLLSIAKMKTRTDRPFLGKKHTQVSLAKMRESHLGQVAWNKGIPRSEETKRKISLANSGRVLSEERKQKISIALLKDSEKISTRVKDWIKRMGHTRGMLNKHHSAETIEKIRQSSKKLAHDRLREKGKFIKK